MSPHSFVIPAVGEGLSAADSYGIRLDAATDDLTLDALTYVLKGATAFKVYLENAPAQRAAPKVAPSPPPAARAAAPPTPLPPSALPNAAPAFSFAAVHHTDELPPTYAEAVDSVPVYDDILLQPAAATQTHKAPAHDGDSKSAPNTAPPAGDKIANAGNAVARGINSAAPVVAAGVVAAGAAAGKYLHKGADLLKSKMRPASSDGANVPYISDSTRTTIHRLKQVSGAAVVVSKALVKGAMAITSVVSAQLSDAIRDSSYGRRLNATSGPRVEAAKGVAVATIQGAVAIFGALESAGLALLGDAASATVTVVQHKYGDDTANVTRDGMSVITNVATAAVDMGRTGVRAMAGSVATSTATPVLSNQPQPSQPSAVSAAAQPSVDPTLRAIQAIAEVSHAMSSASVAAAAPAMQRK
jgi:hypothetical protein